MPPPGVYGNHAYRIRQLHLFLGAVLWRKQVPHCKEEEKQLNRASDGIVLVARLDVADGNGGSRDAVEVRIGVSEEARRRVLNVLEVHGQKQSCQGVWGRSRHFSRALFGGCGEARRCPGMSALSLPIPVHRPIISQHQPNASPTLSLGH